MVQPAGQIYEVGIKSGGWRARHRGGDLDGGIVVSPLDDVAARVNTAGRARDAAIGAGVVFIRQTDTQRIVWRRQAAKLAPGQNISHLLELITEDLEQLDIRTFEEKWGLPPSHGSGAEESRWGLDGWTANGDWSTSMPSFGDAP